MELFDMVGLNVTLAPHTNDKISASITNGSNTIDYDELYAIALEYNNTFADAHDLDYGKRSFSSCINSCKALKHLLDLCPNYAVNVGLTIIHLACVGACHATYNHD
ncbi:uncharacterized protein PRCAT00002046001 [Priceomyces carsonii]|uniref:uncharacterized protein n=1 Tax=Priceomyces carsonii TaxID=28549 RepID=UPI002EDA0158|nr:unnamed protein product [Priceomyces carsonii]